jgi:hypothetical protein
MKKLHAGRLNHLCASDEARHFTPARFGLHPRP